MFYEAKKNPFILTLYVKFLQQNLHFFFCKYVFFCYFFYKNPNLKNNCDKREKNIAKSHDLYYIYKDSVVVLFQFPRLKTR